MKIGIVTQSIREPRVALDVANWVNDIAKKTRKDVSYEIIDVKEFNLPMYKKRGLEGEPQNVLDWSNKIKEMDGFVFLAAEYNHGVTGVFKNALDFLQPEFHNKAVAFVGYGGIGGARTIEQLRSIMAEMGSATTRKNVNLMLAVDFENYSVFKPQPYQEPALQELFGEIELWTKAFKTIR